MVLWNRDPEVLVFDQTSDIVRILLADPQIRSFAQSYLPCSFLWI